MFLSEEGRIRESRKWVSRRPFGLENGRDWNLIPYPSPAGGTHPLPWPFFSSQHLVRFILSFVEVISFKVKFEISVFETKLVSRKKFRECWFQGSILFYWLQDWWIKKVFFQCSKWGSFFVTWMEGPPVFCRTNDSAVTHDTAVGGVGTVNKGFEERLESKIKIRMEKFRIKTDMGF
jgi:hypothetical protein